jgi:hypothetical protein
LQSAAESGSVGAGWPASGECRFMASPGSGNGREDAWRRDDVAERTRVSRPALFLLALAFLFESWIWERLVAAARWILDRIPWEEFRERARARFNQWPAIVSVLAFGLPFLLVEAGTTVCVVMMALGHVLMGAAIYVGLKLALLTAVAFVFDLTKEKLMSLPWFVFLYEKILALHRYADRVVAPYRQAALRALREFRSYSRALWRRLVVRRQADRRLTVTYIKVD